MKKLIFLFMALMTLAVPVNAKTVKKTFAVGGNCGMCKNRIQKAATAVPGVVSAAWNQKTKQCSVVFDNKKTSEAKIQKAIAAVGHDAGKCKADDKAYGKLPGCCKYRAK